MGDLGKLFGYGGVDRRVGVAVQVHPEGGDAVEIAAALGINEMISFCTVDHEGRLCQPFAHGCKRMPEVSTVEVGEGHWGMRGASAVAKASTSVGR